MCPQKREKLILPVENKAKANSVLAHGKQNIKQCVKISSRQIRVANSIVFQVPVLAEFMVSLE